MVWYGMVRYIGMVQWCYSPIIYSRLYTVRGPMIGCILYTATATALNIYCTSNKPILSITPDHQFKFVLQPNTRLLTISSLNSSPYPHNLIIILYLGYRD